MDDLFSKPHQADECTQGAGDNEAALKTIGEQVLTVETQTEMIQIKKKETLMPQLKSDQFEVESVSKLQLHFQAEINSHEGVWCLVASTHVDSMSSGSVNSELTEPVNRHL